MKLLINTCLVLLSLTLASCSNELAYNLAQGADTKQCMDASNNEDKLDCKANNQSYDDYQKQRKKLLEEDSK